MSNRYRNRAGVNRSVKPRQAVRSINYAADILREDPNRTVWIFPQGKILPNDSPPILFFNGLARIIERVADCSAVPLAIRYEFLNEYKPEIFVKIGESDNFNEIDFNSKKLTRNFESRISKTLDELKMMSFPKILQITKNLLVFD